MTETCRLCLSMALVNNCIFDDDNKIYLKIVSCLPVKVSKDDNLPKKICDMCSCKIDDFYEFCNKAVESENRLLSQRSKEYHEISICVTNDPSSISTSSLSDPRNKEDVKFNSNFFQFNRNGFNMKNFEHFENGLITLRATNQCKSLVTSYTQTDQKLNEILPSVDIKQEPQLSIEDDFFDDTAFSIEQEIKGEDDVEQKPEIVEPNKQSKKSKKRKDLKLKIKKSKMKYSVSNYQTDSDDEVSLKNIKLREKKKEKFDLDERLPHLKDIGLEIKEELEVDFVIRGEEWNCCVCFLRCFDREEMLSHYRTHYSDSDRLIEKQAAVPSVVSDEKGKKKKIYSCSVCEKVCETKSLFVRHIKSHGFDKPYKCSLCEKTFRNTLEILKHGKNAHTYEKEEDSPVGKEKETGPQRSIKRFICDLCDETFVYMKYVQIHRNLSHPEARGRHFVNRCLHCRREFAHLNSLRRHLRSHSGEKNFLCYVCGKSLTSREHLKFHIRIHTGFKPNVCKTCGKGFVKKCNLTLHERVHSGEKPHVCSHCGKAFSQRSTLVIHERYHSGARPYVCNLCNKGFVAKGLLSMHMKTSCI